MRKLEIEMKKKIYFLVGLPLLFLCIVVLIPGQGKSTAQQKDRHEFASRVKQPSEIKNTIKSPKKDTLPSNDNPYTQFYSAEEFFDILHKLSRKWRTERGYHLAEDFANYSGPETYEGPHPYGYLREEELRALADSADPDAQILYAHYYLSKKDRKKAFDLFQEVTINTEATGPLGTMGTYLMLDTEARSQEDKNYSPAQKIQDENDALAYFLLMKKRNDPTGEDYLDLAGYQDFSNARRNEITNKALAIADHLNALRAERGLPPHESQSFDAATAMGLTQNQFEQLLQSYSQNTGDGIPFAGKIE